VDGGGYDCGRGCVKYSVFPRGELLPGIPLSYSFEGRRHELVRPFFMSIPSKTSAWTETRLEDRNIKSA
jgi:hypothetical protein